MQTESPESNDNRCVRQFGDGRRCRMLRKEGHPSLCVFHAREEEQLLASDKLAAELSSLSGQLNTVTDINHVLSKVFNAFAEKRISHRTANTLGYLGQLLLQSMPGVRREVNGAVNHPGAYDAMLRHAIPFFQRFHKR